MSSIPSAVDSGAAPRLLEQVRGRIRFLHYSLRTEQAYLDWIKRFIRHFGKRHPREMGAVEVEAFLTHLAVVGNVAASTQNQAKAALLFLYREVLEVELPWLDGIESAKRPARLPVVLTVPEVAALLDRVDGVHALIGRLLYGTGMRLMECLRLRVKDIDFARREILVRDGKGLKDRVTVLPDSLAPAPCWSSCSGRARSTRATWRRGMARCICPLRWSASIRRRGGNGSGSTCFPPARWRSIRARERCAATMCMTRRCSARSAPRF